MRMLTLVLAVLALSAFIGCQSKPMVGSDGQSGQEGITVHGNWTVEVRNPDGSLATRKQFTNQFYGEHLVAGLLSLDVEVTRLMNFGIKDSLAMLLLSDEAECEESVNNQGKVPAMVIHAPNDDGNMFNSIWNATCTLEITGDEPKILTNVDTRMSTTPTIQKFAYTDDIHTLLSSKNLAFTTKIELWDGQRISATVILSVE